MDLGWHFLELLHLEGHLGVCTTVRFIGRTFDLLVDCGLLCFLFVARCEILQLSLVDVGVVHYYRIDPFFPFQDAVKDEREGDNLTEARYPG